MSYNILRVCNYPLLAAALFAFAAPSSFASSAPIISGTYRIVDSKRVGSQAQIHLQIQLLNHGPSNLSIRNMTLWDLSRPDKGGTIACAVTVRAHSSANTTQEFTIRSSDYQSWQKGVRPRLVLQMAGQGVSKSRAVIRLDRTNRQEAK